MLRFRVGAPFALLLWLASVSPAAAETDGEGGSRRDPAAALDPPACREVLAARPEDALEALRAAEAEHMRRARHASYRGKRLLRSMLGGGTTLPTRRAADELAQLQETYHRAVHTARVLCGCRERRGDPYREDCEAAYRQLQAPWGMPRP